MARKYQRIVQYFSTINNAVPWQKRSTGGRCSRNYVAERIEEVLGTEQRDKTENNRVEDLISLAQGNDVNVVQNTQEEDLDKSLDKDKSLKEKLAEFEKKLIKQALIESEGNVTKTAKSLNVQRTTLIEKINKYSINLT